MIVNFKQKYFKVGILSNFFFCFFLPWFAFCTFATKITIMKYTLPSLLFVFSMVLFSCDSNTKMQQPPVKIAPVATHQIDLGAKEEVTFKTKQATKVFYYYTELKNSLVQTDAALSAKASSMLKDVIRSIDTQKTTITALEQMSSSSDIDLQRQKFVLVTSAVEKLLEDQVATGSFFKQYCPMAFNNTGGYWLSNSKEIRNPYFGDKMLKCGRIDKEIN